MSSEQENQPDPNAEVRESESDMLQVPEEAGSVIPREIPVLPLKCAQCCLWFPLHD